MILLLNLLLDLTAAAGMLFGLGLLFAGLVLDWRDRREF